MNGRKAAWQGMILTQYSQGCLQEQEGRSLSLKPSSKDQMVMKHTKQEVSLDFENIMK